ncbi:hypothetical protein [Streptomyces sp. NRRL F-5755]|uniref:hypothetical protein n=1 Tax=Streptomyces sp. NRRL F-5755 TaxID=1519475 RepID=UPI003B6368BF
MDGGETSPAAARELQEETGVTVPAADLSQMGAYDAPAAIPAAGTSRSPTQPPCPRLLPTRMKVTCDFATHVPGISTRCATRPDIYARQRPRRQDTAMRSPRALSRESAAEAVVGGHLDEGAGAVADATPRTRSCAPVATRGRHTVAMASFMGRSRTVSGTGGRTRAPARPATRAAPARRSGRRAAVPRTSAGR